MNLKFKYGTKEIEFEVEHSKRKSIEISIEPPDKVLVKSPYGVDDKKIVECVKSKADWIIKKIYYFKHMQYQPIRREYVNGESFMYLGRNYPLQIEINPNLTNPETKLLRGKFIVTLNDKNEEKIKRAMKLWYRDRAKEVIQLRVEYYQRYFDIQPTHIKIKEQNKRWGSCTSKNELLFNYRGIMAKSNALDYIIVHEMCHMKYKNHSKVFWELVSSVLPDYESRKEWLKNFGVKMDL